MDNQNYRPPDYFGVPGHHGGGQIVNVLYVDGHVGSVKRADLKDDAVVSGWPIDKAFFGSNTD